MNKAIFLDRDGVLNDPRDNYYVYKIEDFILNEGIAESLNELQDRDYMLIVISNQGGISKGIYTKEEVDLLHGHMVHELEKHGVELDAIFYCPHHSSLENCLCRKPEPIMIEKALAQFDIDPEQSWFIGDKKSDVDAGRRAGVNTIKIKENQDLREVLHKIN